MASISVRIENGSACGQHAGAPMLWLLPEHQSKLRQVARGERVYLNRDEPGSVYYLERGVIKLIRISEAGDEVMIDRYYPGSLFGNLCFCGEPVCSDSFEREVAVALEDSKIIVTTLECLKKNIRRSPEKLLALLEDYCRRLASARMRIEGLVLYDAEERLARALFFLSGQANGHSASVILDPPITHEELAHWIGVTRPFVTRLMRQLQERGLIEPLSGSTMLIHRERIAEAYH